MSTILRSLKRLEKEKESRVSQDLALLTAFNTHHAMNRAVKFSWLRKIGLRWGVSVLGVILAVGAFYAFNRSAPPHHNIPPPQAQAADTAQPVPVQKPSDRQDPQPNSISRQDVQPQVAIPQPMPPEGMPKIQPMAIPQISGELPRSKEAWQAAAKKAAAGMGGALPPPNSDHSRPQLDNSSAPLQTPLYSRPPDLSKNPTDKPLAANVSSGPSPTPSTRDNTASPPPDDSLYVNAERMTDGKLKVQAIVWAPRAEDRMAVINNRIVREGAVVESFSIVGIGEDAVYVREEGMRLFKVSFGY